NILPQISHTFYRTKRNNEVLFLLILVNVKDKYSFYFLANAGFFATNEYQHLSNGIVDNCF
ncbi:MAG: hypothetical protein ACLRTH_06040, partial [Streptococcus salivarius]